MSSEYRARGRSTRTARMPTRIQSQLHLVHRDEAADEESRADHQDESHGELSDRNSGRAAAGRAIPRLRRPRSFRNSPAVAPHSAARAPAPKTRPVRAMRPTCRGSPRCRSERRSAAAGWMAQATAAPRSPGRPAAGRPRRRPPRAPGFRSAVVRSAGGVPRPARRGSPAPCCRDAARASSRLATLAQAMSSTSADRPEQDQQRLPDVADDLLVHRHEPHADTGVDVRILALEGRRDHVHFGLRGVAADQASADR